MKKKERKMKILFFDHIGSFSKDIIKELGKTHEVKVVPKQQSLYINQYISEEKPDLIWFEWCEQPLIIASQTEKKEYRVICRLHSYEIFTTNTYLVNWDYVDDLIFVSDHIKELFELNNKVDVNKYVIYNGVDTKKFKFDEKISNKKIAYVGYLNSKKNIHLLLQCFKALKEYDNEYSLHIAGLWQEDRLKLNCFDFIKKTNLKDVHLHNHISDVHNWLQNKSYIVSTSLFESFQYSIMEGMACGCLPLVYNWYGAEKLYPHDCLFLTVDEFVKTIKYYERSDKNNLILQSRKEIEKKFSLEVQINKIKELLNE